MSKIILAVCAVLLMLASPTIAASSVVTPHPYPIQFAMADADYGTVMAHDPLDGGKIKAYPAALPPVTPDNLVQVLSSLAPIQYITYDQLAGGGIQIIVYDCSKPEYVNADASLFLYDGKVSQLIRACVHTKG